MEAYTSACSWRNPTPEWHILRHLLSHMRRHSWKMVRQLTFGYMCLISSDHLPCQLNHICFVIIFFFCIIVQDVITLQMFCYLSSACSVDLISSDLLKGHFMNHTWDFMKLLVHTMCSNRITKYPFKTKSMLYHFIRNNNNHKTHQPSLMTIQAVINSQFPTPSWHQIFCASLKQVPGN